MFEDPAHFAEFQARTKTLQVRQTPAPLPYKNRRDKQKRAVVAIPMQPVLISQNTVQWPVSRPPVPGEFNRAAPRRLEYNRTSPFAEKRLISKYSTHPEVILPDEKQSVEAARQMEGITYTSTRTKMMVAAALIIAGIAVYVVYRNWKQL